MQCYNVRSNCIAPFAWSRMTSSIPAETPGQQARVAKLQQMSPVLFAEHTAPALRPSLLPLDAARTCPGGTRSSACPDVTGA